MKVVFTDEKCRDIKEEIIPLCQAHWEEVCEKGEPELDPDYDAYVEDEKLGHTIWYFARLESSGRLVGYINFNFRTPLHSKSCTMAMQDLFFLHPLVRKGWIGYNFFKYATEQIKKVHILNAPLKYVGLTAHEGHSLLPFVKRLNYKPLYTMYFAEV